jgi:glycosyltransferase involved in cell wall biosynthesis
MAKVTIATITYNSSKFVAQAIESVLAQSFTDFEYLISDDCSTDDTWAIIQTYKDPRIRAWRNEQNLGEYPNRNKTLYEAKGDYIIWIDGDDIFYPHGLEFMLKMLEAFPEAAMACARPYWPDMIYPCELTPEETYKFDYLGSPVTINGFPDTLFKTDILKRVGGLPTNYISGDTFVKKKIAMYHNILLISNGVSWWRMPEEQASSKIRGTILGAKESYAINHYFLYHKDVPLHQIYLETAKENINSGFLRYIFRTYLLRGKVFAFLSNWSYVSLPFFKKIKSLFTPVDVTYKGGASASSPLRSEIIKSPYSKSQIQPKIQ